MSHDILAVVCASRDRPPAEEFPMKDGMFRACALRSFASVGPLFVSLAVAPTALAATLYVDNLSTDTYNPPSGSTVYTTIQAAVDAAAATGDTIKVYPGTYTSTTAEVVNLRGKAIVLEAAIPLVQATAATHVTIDGQDARRCIVATLNETEATIVRGMRIHRGRSSAGGGMYVVNGSPRIDGCWFTSNVATGGVASGGALRLLNSASVISDCDFHSNSAGAEGGAIFNANGAIMLTGCDFAGNTAPRGGGLFTRDDAAMVTDCVFRDTAICVSSWAGLGMYALDSRVTVQLTEFRGLHLNSCCCGGENFGAGIQVIGANSEVLIDSCSFTNNRVNRNGRGGAISIGQPGNNRGSVRIVRSQFLNNFSDLDGGAIAMQSTDRLEIDGANGVPCVFENNSANRHGGAISFNFDWVDAGTLLVDEAQFRNNAAGSQGGAMWIRQTGGSGLRSLTDSVFITNAAANGGGLYLEGTNSSRSQLARTVYCGNDPSDIQGSYIDNGGNCFTTSCSDADNSGYPDTCEIPIIDCNGNDIPDDEELLDNDVNNDGVPDDCQAGNDFAGLETEIRPITHVVNGLPQTAVTWRVYAKFRKGASLATVTALFGNAQWPLLVSNAAGFYQSATGGNTVEDIICNSPDTSLRYDSFFTISAECRSQTDLQFTPGLSFTSFNEATNASLSTSNGAIFVAPGTEASRAGDDLRVLLMQLTTKTAARPTATINLTGDNAAQVPDNEWYAYALPIPEAAVTSAVDCDGNGTHDALDIAGGVRDCNLDGIPDSCQSPDLAADCDGDGTPDACEIRFGLATDTNLDGIPDNCQCEGDVDQNGAVNVDDLLEIFAAWGDPNPGAADLNGDGVCNGQDLVLVLSGWGACL